MGEILRLRLTGPSADPGRIPAADVARLLQGFERAVARAAEARIRRSARAGRKGTSVESTTRLIFRGIESGSLVAVLELPDVTDGDSLETGDIHLGGWAARDVHALVRDPMGAAADRRLVDAVEQLGDELGIGARYQALSMEWEPAAGAPTTVATLDASVRSAIGTRASHVDPIDVREDLLVGTLVEADFESHRAHLRTTDNIRIAVEFDDLQADEVQHWLRRTGRLDARVTYGSGGSLREVELVRIAPPMQFPGFSEAAWTWSESSIDQLIAEQGVEAVVDPSELLATGATDEELDGFLNAQS